MSQDGGDTLSLSTAVFLGILQGFAELFPFSSLGLLVILPHVVHMTVPTSGARYLPFVVALHLGTALALLWYFRVEWMAVVKGWLAWWRGKRTSEGRLGWLLIWGTIPAGIVGLLLKHPIATLFAKPLLAAVFLIINGGLMLWGDRWQKSASRHVASVGSLSIGQTLKIGLFQILALIPGMSRSGATISAGVSVGLSFEEAAHFSFLLATPIILAASLIEIPKLHGGLHGLALQALVGGVLAAITAWLSTRFLMRYFQVHNLFRLALISIGLGIVSLILVH